MTAGGLACIYNTAVWGRRDLPGMVAMMDVLLSREWKRLNFAVCSSRPDMSQGLRNGEQKWTEWLCSE